MTRKPCCRMIEGRPGACCFLPQGVEADAEAETLTLDAFEALRLADFEHLYHAEAAAQMGISRSTFSRLLDQAHLSVARALVLGHPIKIEGGPVRALHRCPKCARLLATPRCPQCDDKDHLPMHLCIPVTEDHGLQSTVNGHFGSAPCFILIDLDDLSFKTIPNKNLNHTHGHCQPLLSFEGELIDAIAVGGIGMGAMTQIQNAGIQVFISREKTVADTIAAFREHRLIPATIDLACAHHHGEGEKKECCK